MTCLARLLLAGLAVLVAGPPAAAQTALPLSLEEAVARGLAQSPRVAEARAREAAQEAALAGRRAAGRPTIEAAGTFLRTNHVREFGVVQPDGTFNLIFPDIPNNYLLRAEMAVPVYTSGRVDALIRGAELDREAAAAERAAVEADIALLLTRAYWTLVLARAREQVLGQSFARAEAVVSDVGARVEAGVLPPNDRLSAEAQRARQEVQLIRARHDAVIAEVTLARLLGLPAGQAITATTPVGTPLPGIETLVTTPAPALVARALEQRPERQGLIDREAAWRAGADAAIAVARPQVSARAAVEPSRPNRRFVPPTDQWDTSWDLGVTVTWALWDGGRAKAESAQALAQAAAVAERRREFDAATSVDVRERVLVIEAGRAALAAADQAVAAAAEARRVIEERFAAGVATSTDVLDAQLVLLETELERTGLLAALRVDEAELLRAVGGR